MKFGILFVREKERRVKLWTSLYSFLQVSDYSLFACANIWISEVEEDGRKRSRI